MGMDIKEFRAMEFARREEQLLSALPQRLAKSARKKELLHLCYVMTWTDISGGSKIILEHANRLVQKGHQVTIVSHWPKPDYWYAMEERIVFIRVPYQEVLCESIPECDLIVATYWREIYEAIQQQIAPVIYFEQGDAHLFDPESLDARTMSYINKQFAVCQYVMTVSHYAARLIKEKYHRESFVTPNALDKSIFYSQCLKKPGMSIALIGSLETDFKGIGTILKAMDIIKGDGIKLKINWISPTEPDRSNCQAINCQAIVNPPQMEIGRFLRASSIYICASKYESFGLPILEAMSCGAAVITTDTGGNRDFVVPGKNALIIEKDAVLDIVEKTKLLIDNEGLRLSLAENGLETAKKYNWESTIDALIAHYQEIAQYRPATPEAATPEAAMP